MCSIQSYWRCEGYSVLAFDPKAFVYIDGHVRPKSAGPLLTRGEDGTYHDTTVNESPDGILLKPATIRQRTSVNNDVSTLFKNKPCETCRNLDCVSACTPFKIWLANQVKKNEQ